jgi:hypothetical protein
VIAAGFPCGQHASAQLQFGGIFDSDDPLIAGDKPERMFSKVVCRSGAT